MFDQDSPYDRLEYLEDVASKLAQALEQLAKLTRDMGNKVDHQDELLINMVRTIQMQYNIITALDDRVKQLEA